MKEKFPSTRASPTSLHRLPVHISPPLIHAVGNAKTLYPPSYPAARCHTLPFVRTSTGTRPSSALLLKQHGLQCSRSATRDSKSSSGPDRIGLATSSSEVCRHPTCNCDLSPTTPTPPPLIIRDSATPLRSITLFAARCLLPVIPSSNHRRDQLASSLRILSCPSRLPFGHTG